MMNSRRSSRQHKDDWLEPPLDEEDHASSCDLCLLDAHERRLEQQPQLQQQPGPSPRERRESQPSKRIPQVTIAAMQGRLEHVRHWIEHAACDVDTVDFMGTMPLHRAALEGHAHVVEYLITRGAALQTRVLDVKDTVLHLASARGHAQVVTALLNAGAHIEARNADNYTPLLAAIRSNQLATVQALIARGASVSAPWAIDAHDVGTGLHLAVQCGHLALTKFLLGVVALDVNQRTRHRKATPLHFAALHGHVKVTQYLIERHHADIRARDARGMTPLHYACDYEYHLTMPIEQHGVIEKRHVDIVTCLLKAGAKVKPRRLRDHATPLRCAAMRGHFQLAKTLLDHGARSNKATQWLFALLWAARDPHKLKLLLSSEANDPSSNQNSRKQSGLSSSAEPTKRGASRDSMSSCGTLPDSPTDMTMLPENGSSSTAGGGYASVTNRLGGSHCSALHRACLDSDLTLLLGALGRIQQQQISSTRATRDDTHEPDTLEARLLPEGLTALHLACRNGWLRGVAALVKCGADLNARTHSNGSTPLHLAAEQGHLAVIKQLVAHGAKVNACNGANATPLLVALRNGRSGAMKYLLRHGASSTRVSISGCGSSMDVSLGDFVLVSAPLPADDGDEDGLGKQEENDDEEALVRVFNPKHTTALHVAAFYGRVDIVRQLVCEGEDVEARDQDGATPVWLAALMGHLDVVECLAEHGANLNAVAKSGASVAVGAAEFGHLEVLAFLTAPTPALSFERLSLTRLSLQDHHGLGERTSLTSLTT
ncbi:hypothetical protein Gpo141_00010854 [Globisporangium polare]